MAPAMAGSWPLIPPGQAAGGMANLQVPMIRHEFADALILGGLGDDE